MRPLACAQVQNDKENKYSSKNDKEENLSINNRTTTIPSRLQNNAPVKLMIIYSWSYSRFVLCLWVVICDLLYPGTCAQKLNYAQGCIWIISGTE